MRVNNPLSELRPAFIKLTDIAGVDIEAGTFVSHPDFQNSKTFIREDVIESLRQAKGPDEIPPIEVYLHKDGSVCVLAGQHRVLHAVQRAKTDSAWLQIRAARFFTESLADAQIRALTGDLDFTRGNLTEPEEVGVVERLLRLGLSHDHILGKLGRGNKRWINKIHKVLEATPGVLEAVKAGKLSLESGSKIADHIPAEEQAVYVEHVSNTEQTIGGVAARKDAGLRKDRIKTAPAKTMWKEFWPIFEEIRDCFGTKDCDPETEGRFAVFSLYFGWNERNHEELMKELQPKYDEFCAGQNKKGK